MAICPKIPDDTQAAFGAIAAKVCSVRLLVGRSTLRRKGGLYLAHRADFQRPVWRHMPLHSENHAAPTSECCVSKHQEGQWRQSPASLPFDDGWWLHLRRRSAPFIARAAWDRRPACRPLDFANVAVCALPSLGRRTRNDRTLPNLHLGTICLQLFVKVDPVSAKPTLHLPEWLPKGWAVAASWLPD